MRYPRLRYYSESGRVVASDALLMCFYMQQPHKRIAPAVMRALEIFRDRIGPHQLEWYVDHEGQMDPLDDSVWRDFRESMLGPDEVAVPRLQGSQWVGGFNVDYRGLPVPLPGPGRENDVSALFLSLATEYLEEQGSNRIRALALEVAEELPFNSGYVDFAFCEAVAVEKGTELVRTRYPGVHLSSNGPDIHVSTCVDGVHWMNFLGQPVLGKLGGVAGLRERLSSLPGRSLQELRGDRVLVTLGEQPEVGDVEAGQALPLHRALARLLEPYLYHRQQPFGGMRREEQLRWERRFLD